MSKKNKPIDYYYSSDTPFANEFRRLLVKIIKSGTGSDEKSIMLTSAMLSEGKSTICSFLGITAAKQNGLKTLIIDSDLRRPSIHRFFDVERKHGISDILVDGFAAVEAVKRTSIEKLDIITSGSSYAHPAEIFDAESIGYIIEELKFYYDLILVDAAPLMPVSDPLLLATKVDKIILVVKAGSTDREVVIKSAEILSSSRDKILGVVMNNMSNSLPYYYDYQYYGYDYAPSKSSENAPLPNPQTIPKKARTRKLNSISIETKKSK